MHKIFGCPKLFQIIGGFSTNFSALWDESNQQKKETTIIRKILKPEYFWNTDRFAHDDFRRRETKKSIKMVIACYPKFFRYQNLSEKQEPPTKIFDIVRQKQSTEEGHYYYPKNYETIIFLKHRRVRPRWFSATWDKKFQRNGDSLLSKNFSIPELFRKTGFLLRNFSALRDKTIDRIVVPLLSKTFWYQYKSETQNGSPTMFLATWDKKTSTENRDTPLLIHKLFPY